MTHHTSLPINQIQFFATSPYPCSYIEGNVARSQVASPSEQIDKHLYSGLVHQGFRRSGGFVYRPHCDHCRACTSIRIPVAEFLPTRSQRRAKRQHGHLVTSIYKPFFSDEHYALYQCYQKTRHTDGGMNKDGKAQYVEFLVQSRVDSYMVEFRDSCLHNTTGELRMVSIVDKLSDGLSAVYTFYDPRPSQSYGTFSVLWQIENALALGLPYLYLGYWIGQSHKMSYKSNFQPFELLQENQWVRNCEEDLKVLFFTK